MGDDTDNTDNESVDLEELVGGILDKRGLTESRMASLDSLGGLREKIEGLFKNSGGNTPANPGPTFDEEGFLSKVGELIDGKLAASKPEPKVPPLKKWLGLS